MPGLFESLQSDLTIILQNGIQYIAQVLKRNRTLKVLNLSENKIDVQGLVAIAESLVSSLNIINLERKTNC